MLDAFLSGNLLQITSKLRNHMKDISCLVRYVTGNVGYLERFTELKYL